MPKDDALICAAVSGKGPAWCPGAGEVAARRFFTRAVDQGLAVLVYERLKASPAWETYPPELREALAGHARRQAIAELARARELASLVTVLGEADIRPLVLKGGALAYTHYESPVQRERVDTDLFIDVTDLPRMLDVIAGAGYQVAGPVFLGHQFSCFSSAPASAAGGFDVHWRINNSPGFACMLGYAECLDASVSVPVAGFPVLTLHPVHAFLLACVHRVAAKNSDPNRLLWIHDLHLLLKRMSAAELDLMAELAIRKNVSAECLAGIEQAWRFFGTRVPGEILDGLERNRRGNGRSGGGEDLTYRRLIQRDLGQLPGLMPRVALLRELLFPPASFVMERYGLQNRSRLPILYLRRFAEGVVKHFGRWQG